MKRVKFVRGLDVEDAILHEGKHAIECRRYAAAPVVPVIGSAAMLETAQTVETQVAPIMRFCESGKPDVFVAYHPDVEELLGVPFKVMHEQIEAQNRDISALHMMVTTEQNLSSTYRRRMHVLLDMRWWDKLNYLLAPEWTLRYLIPVDSD